MKIAQVVCTFPPYKGGMGNTAYNFAEALTTENKVTTILPAYDGKASEESTKFGKVLRIKPLLKYGNGAFLPQLFFILRKYDIIYLHYPFFGGAEMVWLFRTIFRRKKLIIHYHMDVEQASLLTKILSIPSNLIRTSLFSSADKITCASLDYIESSQIKKYYHKYPQKFIEIPFGVDTEKFHPSPDADAQDSKALKLLFVGGLDRAHYFKGIKILIDALVRIKDKNWTLDIVGDGDMRADYEKQSAEADLNEKIRFLGKLSDTELPICYRKHDVLILPSINGNEAFGLVILEALASGLAIIASSLPGVRKVFHDEEEGFFVEPQNAMEIEHAINKFLNYPEMLQNMKTNARLLAETKYDIRIMNEKLCKVVIFIK